MDGGEKWEVLGGQEQPDPLEPPVQQELLATLVLPDGRVRLVRQDLLVRVETLGILGRQVLQEQDLLL